MTDRNLKPRLKKDSIKVGDVVRVHDGSYSASIVGEEFTHIYGVYLNKPEQKFKVLATNCRLPTSNGAGTAFDSRQNDIIIQEIGTGRVVFICSAFVSAEPTYCPTCGHKIHK